MATSQDMAAIAPPGSAGEGAPRPRRLLAAVTAVGCLVAGGVMGDRLLGPVVAPVLAERAAPAVASSQPAAPASLHLIDNLVVNPAGSRGTRFLLATIAVEVAAPELLAGVAARDVVLRSALLLALGAMTVDELTDIAHRPVVMEALRETVVGVVGADVVRNVFVPQFVIQ